MLVAVEEVQTHLEVQAVEELVLHLRLVQLEQLIQVVAVEQQILVQHQVVEVLA
jgi:hypothetical protein